MADSYSPQRMRAFLAETYGDTNEPEALVRLTTVVNGWLARGDGVAIYTNTDLGSPHVGAVRMAPFGSPDSQITTPTPPQTLPDFGHENNWGYTLTAIYRGEAL